MTEPNARKIEGLTPKQPAPLSRLIAAERPPVVSPPAEPPREGESRPAEPATAGSSKRPARARTTRRAASGEKRSVTFYAAESIQGRARAAYLHTRHLEGDTSFSDMLAKALEADVARRERQYNDGKPFPSAGGALPAGRPLET